MQCLLKCGLDIVCKVVKQSIHTERKGDHMFVGGSSTGSAIAVAANFTVVSVGTETDASILSPAVQNSVVGIKPTVGLISQRNYSIYLFTRYS